MSHTTQQQPTPADVLTALRAVADQIAYHLTHFDDLPMTTSGDVPCTYLTVSNIDRALAIVGGMAGDVDFREHAGQSYLTKTWRGSVTGWQLCVIITIYGTPELVAVDGDPAADLLADVDEHQDVDAAQPVTSADRLAAAWRATVPVDTSPATAAGEQPAGPVDTWPAVVPAQRPPVELLPSPSWARVSMTTAFPAEPVGVVRPLTDPALIGHDPTAPQDDEQPAGQLVDLADVRAARVAAAADSEVHA